MEKSNRTQYKGESWKWIEKIIHHGYSKNNVFCDWLDLMLLSQLALTDNLRRGNLDARKFDGQFNDEYLAVMRRYDNEPKYGERPADCFARAYAHLLMEIEESGGDPLGELYMMEISYGEHGQFFTPAHVGQMMAKMTLSDAIEDGQSICDPTCGGGTLLIEAGRLNRTVTLTGIDLDERCAKMAALNMLFRGLTSHIYCGNSLTGQMYTAWHTGVMIGLPYIEREEKPPGMIPRTKPQEVRQLTL